jgi:HNH endonuclease
MSPKRVTSILKQSVSTRAKNYCEYCRSPGKYSTDSFTVDHVKPRQAGGENTLDNLAWACLGCNGHKHTKTDDVDPETGEKVALFNPRQQVWTEHFGWSEDFTEVIGKTPCGRATVNVLRLNRTGLVNLRRLLIIAELHPPAEI